MATLRRMIEIGIDARKAKQGGKEVEGALDRVTDKTRTGRRELDKYDKQQTKTAAGAKKLARGLGLLFGGFAAVGAIRSTIRTYAQFEEVITTVGQVSGASAAQLAALESVALDLGATTRYSATEAGEGLLFLARAGFTVNEAITAVPATLNLAAAGAIGLGEAADFASNILSAFQLGAEETERVVDTLVKTSNRSNTDVRQLAEAMKYAAPVAGALGIEVENAAAAIGVLGDSGIQGSLAGTNLRGVLSALLKPTTDGQKAIERLVGSLETVNPATNSVTDIFGKFRAAGLSAADAVAIFGRRNAAAALVLTNGVEKIAQLTEENENAKGTAQEFADVLDQTTKGQWKAFISAVQKLQLQIGKRLEPALKLLLNTLTGAARLLGGVTVEGEEASTAAKVLAATVKLVVLTLSAMLGLKVLGWLAKFALGMGKAAFATARLTSASTLLAGALAGLLAFDLGKTLYNEFQVVQEGMAKLINFFQVGWEKVKSTTKILGLFIKKVFFDAIEYSSGIFSDMVDSFGQGLADLEDIIGINLGSGDVRAFSRKLKLDLGFDFNDEFDKVNRAADEAIRGYNAVLDETLRQIEEDFKNRGDDAGRSFMDAYLNTLVKDVDRIAGALIPAGKETKAALDDLLENADLGVDPALLAKLAAYEEEIAGISESMDQLDDSVDKAKQSLADMEAGLVSSLATVGLTQEETARYKLELDATAAAQIAFGDSSEEAANAVTDLLDLFDQLTRRQDEYKRSLQQNELDKQLDMMREEIDLLSLSSEERERQIAINKFSAKALAAYADDQDKANKKIEEFTDLLDKLAENEKLTKLGEEIGDAFGQTFEDIIFGVDSVEDAVEAMVKNVAKTIFNQLVTQQIAGFFGGLFGPGGGFGGLFGGGAAMGGVVKQGSFTAFASGGIVDQPTFFPMSGNRTGLVGEGKLPEAIVPLPDGRSIPVKMEGDGGGTTVNVKMTVVSPNPDAFRASEEQIATELSRKIRRRA